jgi:protein gp37
MRDLKDKIETLEKMGADVQIISKTPLILKVEKIPLTTNLGVIIISDISGETRIYPERDWNCKVTEIGFKEFMLKFDAEP